MVRQFCEIITEGEDANNPAVITVQKVALEHARVQCVFCGGWGHTDKICGSLNVIRNKIGKSKTMNGPLSRGLKRLKTKNKVNP